MRVLVTGGSGSLGSELVPALAARGREVVVLDRQPGAAAASSGLGIAVVEGAVEDRTAVEKAVRGAEVVIHMAWSFAEDPATLLERDLRGHQVLLDACRAHAVRHFVYTSTAVVYGKPVHVPIREDDPLRALEARKPSYGVAKEFAEKLALLATLSGGPPATILRFWWAFGADIGGRHLRDMLRDAAAGKDLLVPGACGGSFLSIEDFIHAIELVMLRPESFGQVFNLSSAYVEWEEIARMAVEVTGSSARVVVVPSGEWKGAAFLADSWRLDDDRIRRVLGFEPRRDARQVRDMLKKAMGQTWKKVVSPS